MSILKKIESLMSESSTNSDIARLSRIKKMLNLKESESISTVPTTKLQKFCETYGNIAVEGLQRYAVLTEDVAEKKRIASVLSMLGVKK
jgi:predicted transcriptional regulator